VARALLTCALLMVLVACADNTKVTDRDPQQAGPWVGLEAPSPAVDVGELIEVNVLVTDIEELYAVELQVDFNADHLEVVDVAEDVVGVQVAYGELLNADYIVRNEADNETGTILYAISQMNPHEPVDGDGVLAHIRFRGISAGEAEVKVTHAILATIAPAEIPADTGSGITLRVR
jgi:hypothetical protein